MYVDITPWHGLGRGLGSDTRGRLGGADGQEARNWGPLASPGQYEYYCVLVEVEGLTPSPVRSAHGPAWETRNGEWWLQGAIDGPRGSVGWIGGLADSEGRLRVG